MTRLSPAMRRQLQALEGQANGLPGGDVHLGTMRALINRGLAKERFGEELLDGDRLLSGYVLTPAGRAALNDEAKP